VRTVTHFPLEGVRCASVSSAMTDCYHDADSSPQRLLVASVSRRVFVAVSPAEREPTGNEHGTDRSHGMSMHWSFLLLATAVLACATEPAFRPPAPIIDSAIPGDGSAEIAFTQPGGSSQVVVQYAVECSGSDKKHTASGPASPITVAGLTNGIVYSCTVTAVSEGRNSVPSSPVLVTPGTALFRLRLILLSPGNGATTAHFDPPFPNATQPGTNHTVTCGATGHSASANGPSSPITVSGVTNGLTYSCNVRRTSPAGTEVSNSLNVIPGTPTRPFAPTVTPGDATATITFSPSSDNGSPITGYTATCSATGQPSRTADGSSSPITVTGLTNGVTYSCDVYASNAVGPGQHTASLPVTVGVPTAPTSVAATPGSASATFSFAPPVSDGGSAITSYTVACARVGPGADPPNASGPSSPITMTGMIGNLPHECRLWATNQNGNGLWAFISVTPLP
jgi:hypothetical protein